MTLQSIARQLGLHVSTVSRILNGSGDDQSRAASKETAERVRDLANQLGYRPNPHATSLRTQRSGLIGVTVPRLSDLVLATIYEGIEEAAAELGLWTFVTNTRDRPADQRARTQMILDRRVDGLIIGDAHLDGQLLDTLAERGVKFALVNRRSGDYPAVTCDDRLGGRLAAEHLLQLGHHDAAVIAGEPHASTGVERTAGFLGRFREAGIHIPAERVVTSGFDTLSGRNATERVLGTGRPPTALFAVNDFAAIGAAGAARDRGLRVGDDISIVGFNDTPLAAELPVPLTTVRSDMRRMGNRAVHLLAKVIAGQETCSETLPPSMVVRESTRPPVSP